LASKIVIPGLQEPDSISAEDDAEDDSEEAYLFLASPSPGCPASLSGAAQIY
jgi:hypothetical protein